MPAQKPNIVQVEFFLIVDKGKTLEEFVGEVASRIADALEDIKAGVPPQLVGPKMKLCLRFFDVRGEVTKLLEAHGRHKKSYYACKKKLTHARGFTRLLLLCTQWYALERMHAFEQVDCFDVVLEELLFSLKTKKQVAIENPDHTYRAVLSNEVHELIESVASTRRSFWLFLFSHNNLLSGSQVNLASVM